MISYQNHSKSLSHIKAYLYIIMYHIAISNQLFCEFSGPLVTVSTAVITVIHSAEVVHFTHKP